ncbi:MAG: PEP-CTERM sorting domain-containing protein [Gammaproteobacteria bacterium]|nr:PEP-CTERM sorting domain-containing protein [Gammaproteobacteria bacterium]
MPIRIIEKSARVILLASCFAAPATSHAMSIISTFDTGAEGWSANPGQGSLAYFASNGNPGGHIRITDIGAGINNGFASGAFVGPQFLGDQSAFDGGTLALDMATFAGGGGTFASFGTVLLTGNGSTVTFDLAAVAPSGGWQSYSASLDAASWGVSQTDWLAILSDVTSIGIATDAFDGADTIGIDNFQLRTNMAALPAPATLALLGLGLAGIGFTRRKRGA